MAHEITELYLEAAENEPRRLRIFQNDAESEELGLGKAGTWGYAWYDVDGTGFATEDEARQAAMVAGAARYPGLDTSKTIVW
jgi:hypothetical protein